MCRLVRQGLGPALSAVAESRRVVRSALTRWELPELAPDAELMVSELTTNAVLHGGGPVELSVAVAAGGLEVGVSDRSTEELPRVPSAGAEVAPPDMAGLVDWDSEGGRGLRLVNLLSAQWGVAVLPTGKQVWFRLDIDPAWPHWSQCLCPDNGLDEVSLASGRFAVAMPGAWDDAAS